MTDVELHRPSESPAEWTRANLAVVTAVLVRVVRDPARAFDLATELACIAALRWDTYDGSGSRTAWVLGFAQALVTRMLEADRIPCDERTRNRSWLEPRTLTDDELDRLRALADAPLDLDPESRRVAAQLQREAPPPERLRRVSLSPLFRVEGVGERA